MIKTFNNYGIWQVTTEGDCEGKSITDLGIHEGYIDDIAFKLGSKVYYSLCFKLINKIKKEILKPVNKVNIHLDINSGTWDLHGEARLNYFRNLLKNRDIKISECPFKSSLYYGCVTLEKNNESKT